MARASFGQDARPQLKHSPLDRHSTRARVSTKDLEQITAAFRAVGPIRPPQPRDTPLPCPICATPMPVERIHGITIDACPNHGIWFDSGEVDVLVHRVQRGERITTSQAVAEASRQGKLAGIFLGFFALFVGPD